MADKLETEVRREQIAQAALSLVASQGLKAMTLTRVARLVGLVPSAIYRHFKNKGEVIDATLDLIRHRLLTNVTMAREATCDPLDALRRLLMSQIQLILEYQAIPRILFSDDVYSGDSKRRGKFQAMINDFVDGVEGLIRQGQQKGIIREDLPSRKLAIMFLGLFQPSALLWHVSGGQFDMIEQTDATWRMFRKAIAVCEHPPQLKSEIPQ